jgi:hypothetical protein
MEVGQLPTRMFRNRGGAEELACDRLAGGEARVTIALDHVPVPAHDKNASARFLAEMLGLENLGLGSTSGYPAFARARVGVTTLDFTDAETVSPQHLAFVVGDEDLDAILARVKAAGLNFYADPGNKKESHLSEVIQLALDEAQAPTCCRARATAG